MRWGWKWEEEFEEVFPFDGWRWRRSVSGLRSRRGGLEGCGRGGGWGDVVSSSASGLLGLVHEPYLDCGARDLEPDVLAGEVPALVVCVVEVV